MRRRLILQADRRDARCDVETLIAFEADRLQRDRFLETAEQYIGVDSNTDRSPSGDAAVIACQRAWRQISCRRDNTPNNHTALQIADVDSVLEMWPT